MKNFLALFFSMPAKIIMVILLFINSLFIGNIQLKYFTYFNEDNESFVNAITQIDSFNYESSHYFRNSVKNTIENITLFSMEYSEIFQQDVSAEKFLAYCSSIGDTTFPRAYEQLKGMKGLRFALINHSEHKIYSNIKEINGKDSSLNVRKHFGEGGKTLLIARSCKNPYFATDRYIDYAEHIRNCAEKYEDNFDLYISFGTEKDFNEKEAFYRELHFNMREKIEKLNDTIAILAALAVLIIIVILTVTGKSEPGGKTYPTIMNRLPNDLLILIYGIVLACIITLYRTAASMLVSHGNELDEFWFTHSIGFYENRIRFCVVIFVCAATNIICILKRQYKMGTLVKNTFIYDFLNTFRTCTSDDGYTNPEE